MERESNTRNVKKEVHRFLGVSLLVFFILTQSCVRGAPEEEEPTLPVWVISENPVVEIGAEGDPRYEFHRIVDVTFHKTGSVVVANSGSQELKTYERDGRFSGSFGSPGEGPGEFHDLKGLLVNGDSLIAFELPFRGPVRIHTFRIDSGFLSTSTVRFEEYSQDGASPLAFLSPNDLVVTRGQSFRVVEPPAQGVIVRDSTTLGIFSFLPQPVMHWLGVFKTASLYSFPLPEGRPVSRSVAGYSLGPALVRTVSSGRLWIGDSGDGRITQYGASGVVVSESRYPVAARSFDEAALLEARREAMTDVRSPNGIASARITELYSERLLPRKAPLFVKIHPGVDGEVWVESFSELPHRARDVYVLDRSGAWIAKARFPGGVRIHEISHDRVAGVRTDADGVERVVLYSLGR